MTYYIVYERDTGRILQTHATYIMGSDEPVETDEAELLAMAKEEFGEQADLAVAKAPPDFDPRARTQKLGVDPKRGHVSVAKAERPGPKRK